MIKFFEDNFIENYEPNLLESDKYWIEINCFEEKDLIR